MLPEQRLSVVAGREKAGSEIQIKKQHSGGGREDRDRQQKKNRRNEKRPYRQWQSEHGHPGCAHIDDGGDVICGAGNGSKTIDKQANTPEALTGLRSVINSVRRERRIGSPSTGRESGRNEKAGQQDKARKKEEPIRECVEERESHVWRPNL